MRLRPPQRARADEARAADRDVDERDVRPFAHARPRARTRAAGRWRPARSRRSPVARPATVVSRRSGKALLVPVEIAQMRGVAAGLGDDAVRAVAAEHDDRRHVRVRASRASPRTSRARNRRAGSRSSSSSRGARRRARRWRCSVVESPSAAGSISTRSTPAAPSPHMQPVDHRGLVGVAEHRRARHQAADVPPGGGVGDDADGRHARENPTPRRVAGALRGS